LLINGKEGPLQANFLSTNSLVKIISNPSMMVRDGVGASINVGSNVSVVGQTTQDPINGDRQTSNAEYRKTGIAVNVKPTINADGVVILEINQVISNSVPGTSGAGGNPDIFERSLSTEVVAQSGQTVLLAGLISENSSSGGSGAPGLSKIPLFGNLFKSKAASSDRTELVMLITARVVEDTAAWDSIIGEFTKGLEYLELE
jgi:general secretion pathway protein D